MTTNDLPLTEGEVEAVASLIESAIAEASAFQCELAARRLLTEPSSRVATWREKAATYDRIMGVNAPVDEWDLGALAIAPLVFNLSDVGAKALAEQGLHGFFGDDELTRLYSITAAVQRELILAGEAELASLKAKADEGERLREALEFYANPEVYKPHPHGPAFDRRDLSFKARAALAGSPSSTLLQEREESEQPK